MSSRIAAVMRSAQPPARGPDNAALYERLQQEGASRDARRQSADLATVPGEPKVTVNPDGRMTIVSPDGGTTINYPDGRTTHVSPDGRIENTGVPGRGIEQPIPQQIQEMTIAFLLTTAFVAVGLPIARAFGRRIDRSRGKVSVDVPPDLGERMDRIEHAVDSVAIEVERISEGQRFTTKLMSEMRPATAQLGASAHPDAATATAARRDAVAVPASERRS